MDKEILKNILIERQRSVPRLPLLVRRSVFGETSNYVLLGLRRAGKSYMLFQDIQESMKQGKAVAEDILYVNFEDERLMGMRASELGLLLESYAELYGERRPRIYLDEIQNVEGWEKFARRLADSGYRVMITGSNARMLSREISSTLGGRYIPREVFPFSFAEYLRYEGVELGVHWMYDEVRRATVVRHFDTYFHMGGIAESFRQVDRREYLNALYQKILIGDIVERNRIRNARMFRFLARKLADGVLQPSSLSRLQHLVKSTGDTISPTVLKDYLDYMEDAYLTFSVPNLVSNMSERETLKKRYIVDNGILNLFLIGGETKLLENLVATTLNRRLRSLDGEPQFFYYNRGMEVDFCVPSTGQAIQVSYSLSDPDTRERELGALVKFLRAQPDYTGLIITRDQTEHLEVDGHSIRVVPVWRWLLEQEYL